MAAEPVDGDHQDEADADPADRRERELAEAARPADALADGGGEGDLEGGDGGGVVHQGLALEDGGYPVRQPELAGDRGRRDRVRRRDDRAEDERRRQRQVRDEDVREPADGDGGEEDVPDREEGDGPDVGP